MEKVARPSNKLKKEDLQLLEMLKHYDDIPNKPIQHNYIHISIDRKYIGMTKKERKLKEKKGNEK